MGKTLILSTYCMHHSAPQFIILDRCKMKNIFFISTPAPLPPSPWALSPESTQLVKPEILFPLLLSLLYPPFNPTTLQDTSLLTLPEQYRPRFPIAVPVLTLISRTQSDIQLTWGIIQPSNFFPIKQICNYSSMLC